MNSPDEESVIGYSPPLSLWKLVEQHIDVHEQDEIKSMLGAGVVDETLELHEELQAFLSIWRDCRSSAAPQDAQRPYRLPEPPGMRGRLVQEIKFFVENIREKAQEQGRDEDCTLTNYNQTVINYVINNESRATSCDPLSRPVSVIGRDGRETPSYRHGSPASDRISLSTYSSLSEDVEAMADKLNVLKLDEVVQHLRSYLGEEKEWLIQDLRFLQECIEEENEVSTLTPGTPEPTMGELRGERLKLEKDMLSDVFMNQKVLHTGLSTLKPASAKSRTPIVPTNKPLKAVHVTAPDGIVLTGNVPDSVIAKAQQKLNEHTLPSGDGPYLIKADCLSKSQLSGRLLSAPPHAKECTVTIPKPHSVTGRPSSANRFRSMVMTARSARGDQ